MGWLSQTRPIPRSPDGDKNDGKKLQDCFPGRSQLMLGAGCLASVTVVDCKKSNTMTIEGRLSDISDIVLGFSFFDLRTEVLR